MGLVLVNHDYGADFILRQYRHCQNWKLERFARDHLNVASMMKLIILQQIYKRLWILYSTIYWEWQQHLIKRWSYRRSQYLWDLDHNIAYEIRLQKQWKKIYCAHSLFWDYRFRNCWWYNGQWNKLQQRKATKF